MLLKGDALISTFTFSYTVHGKPNDWSVTVTGPGGLSSESTTQDATAYSLLDEMLSDMFAAACRRFPQRVPAHLRAGVR